MDLNQKADFLQHEYLQLLHTLDPQTSRQWGKMNVQQMIEHMSDSVRIANGRELHTCITPVENIAKMQAFILSDKPFRENTPNALMASEPQPVRHTTLDAAIDELRQELQAFEAAFQDQPERSITNPFFGDLNYELWLSLLYKHALHHLRQFGVLVHQLA
jgi:hypothetical protein